MLKNNIGNCIKNARLQKKLTQDELGEKLGINGKSVSKWERNVTYPSLNMLKKTCFILNISSDNLLSINRVPENEVKLDEE